MKGALSIPPLRDLPPGRLAQRGEHLLFEITRERGSRGALARPWPSRWGRRGRRRLLVLAAAVLVVVVGTASAFGGVRAFFLDRGFIGLPPLGATPSTPESGELEIFYWGHGDPGDKPGDGPGIMAWVYADGRLISLQMGSDLPESANPLSTGFLEQRLTPEGVELLRSEVASTGLFDRDRVLVTDRGGPRFVDVRNGDRLVHLGVVRECGNAHAPCLLPIPGAMNATPEQANALYRLNSRLSDPASWLPESAWADRDIRAYVSSKYAVCYGGWPPDQQVERSRVLALLPAAARDLLGGDTQLRQGPLFGEPGNFRPSYAYCADMTTNEARVIAVALDDAGLERASGANRLHYRIEAPGSNPGEASIYFEPYLPHGEIVCTVCG
jgi:hypothetical protein